MWLGVQEDVRERYWPDVERLLSGLPPRLFRQAKLLEYDLALRYSDTGRFRDIFVGPGQFPVLSIGSWLLRDLDDRQGPERDEAERGLLVAGFLLAARSHVMEGIGDPASFYDDGHLVLVRSLSERATLELARIVPPHSSFWLQYEAMSGAEMDRDLERRELRASSDNGYQPEALLDARWSATARILALAATTHVEREDLSAGILGMLDEAATAFAMKDDLASLHRDVLDHRPTYSIAVIAHEAHLGLRPWPEPTVVLGALVATRAAETILESALSRLASARRTAEDVGLATFGGYLADLETAFEARRRSLSGDTGPVEEPLSPLAMSPLITMAEPTIPKALSMAEGFLLSDPTFRESWESHREGMFGSPDVSSRYPAGLILEILGRHDHDVSSQVEDFLDFTDRNGFRYYDHPRSDADSDTVGVFLRLMGYSARLAERERALETVLTCLDRKVRETDAIPVWITGCDKPEKEAERVIDLGEGCGTVAAHLLLGLIGAALEGHHETIERGARHLVGRIQAVGLGVNVNYPPLYALAAFLRLTSRLEASGARSVLLDALARAAATHPRSAQEAALLTIASLDADRPDLVSDGWLAMMMKRQRFDGSWIGEPFAAAPNRGRAVTWYSSTILTTALCYDALGRSNRLTGGV